MKKIIVQKNWDTLDVTISVASKLGDPDPARPNRNRPKVLMVLKQAEWQQLVVAIESSRCYHEIKVG